LRPEVVTDPFRRHGLVDPSGGAEALLDPVFDAGVEVVAVEGGELLRAEKTFGCVQASCV